MARPGPADEICVYIARLRRGGTSWKLVEQLTGYCRTRAWQLAARGEALLAPAEANKNVHEHFGGLPGAAAGLMVAASARDAASES